MVLWSSTKQSVCNNFFKVQWNPMSGIIDCGESFLFFLATKSKCDFRISVLAVFYLKKIVWRFLNSWQTMKCKSFSYATDPQCLLGQESCFTCLLVSLFLLVLKWWTWDWFLLKAWNCEFHPLPPLSTNTSFHVMKPTKDFLQKMAP